MGFSLHQHTNISCQQSCRPYDKSCHCTMSHSVLIVLHYNMPFIQPLQKHSFYFVYFIIYFVILFCFVCCHRHFKIEYSTCIDFLKNIIRLSWWHHLNVKVTCSGRLPRFARVHFGNNPSNHYCCSCYRHQSVVCRQAILVPDFSPSIRPIHPPAICAQRNSSMALPAQ